MESFSIKLIGPVPSKKNRYSKGKWGRGRKGMYKGPQLQSQLDYLAMQIPLEYKNLRLVDPDVAYLFRLPRNSKHHMPWKSDWDGKTTTIQDLLVQWGIFRDDSFHYHNGTKTILPAEEIDGPDEAIIMITPRGAHREV